MILLVADAVSQNLTEPATRVFARVVEYLPNLLGAAALILVGVIAAYILRVVCRYVAGYVLRRVRRRSAADAPGEQAPLYAWLPGVIGGVVFWIVLLFFVAAGIEALGLEAISGLFASLTNYLPRVVAVAIIALVGLVLGDYTRLIVTRAASRAHSAFAEALGRGAQAAVWLIVVLVAIEQLGVNSTAIVIVLAIAAGSLFGAAALAFGLGATSTVGNIIAAHYVHKSYRVGDEVKIGDQHGRIVEISRVYVVLKTPDGRVTIPASQFSDEASTLLGEGD